MTSEKPHVLVLAGYSAAGKSTLSRQLRDGSGYSFIEHQPLVHDLAVAKGHQRARHWLAEVGIREFTDQSIREMVLRTREIVDGGGTKVVFDVAYGTNMLESFREGFPELYLLVVSVIADEATRLGNIKKRMKTNSTEEAQIELNFRDRFLHEVGLDEVLRLSDFGIVNDGRPIGETASELHRRVNEYLHGKD